MKETITELWKNIGVYSRKISIQSEEEKELMKALNEYRLEILEKTNNEVLVENFEECYNEILDIECQNAFTEGFSMAVKLFSEALNK